jgi:hypothetical protein
MVLAAASCGSLLRGASCRSRRSFAEKVARDIDYRKASSLFCAGFEICLNEDLNGLLAGINFDADGRITEIYLVSASIAPSDDRMRHFCATPGYTLKATHGCRFVPENSI